MSGFDLSRRGAVEICGGLRLLLANVFSRMFARNIIIAGRQL